MTKNKGANVDLEIDRSANAMTSGFPKVFAKRFDPVNDTSHPRNIAATDQLLNVRVMSIRYAARDTRLYEFAGLNGEALPTADAGSHVDLHLANGLVRQYSLAAPGTNPASYIIGIKRDAQGKGGSRYIHETLRTGDELKIGAPRNNFPLNETALHTVLFAGGIGITPIWAMAQRLMALGKSWEMHYATRTRADTAFIDHLTRLPQAHLHFSDENEGRRLDVAGIAANAENDAHLYCCGPVSMLRAFEDATSSRPKAHVHVEYFAAKDSPLTTGGFILELARSGKVISVPAGKSILDVVREAGIDVASSCEQGVCGACETAVLAGTPDHRDAILSEAERVENRSMMICCSGAKSDHLKLDL